MGIFFSVVKTYRVFVDAYWRAQPPQERTAADVFLSAYQARKLTKSVMEE